MNSDEKDFHICEYSNCDKQGTVWIEDIKAWVCPDHADSMENHTGYCSVSCMLGCGCDGSC